MDDGTIEISQAKIKTIPDPKNRTKDKQIIFLESKDYDEFLTPHEMLEEFVEFLIYSGLLKYKNKNKNIKPANWTIYDEVGHMRLMLKTYADDLNEKSSLLNTIQPMNDKTRFYCLRSKHIFLMIKIIYKI